MSTSTDLLNSIEASGRGLTLAELLAQHPAMARRTAQRHIAWLLERGQIIASGQGRARLHQANHPCRHPATRAGPVLADSASRGKARPAAGTERRADGSLRTH